MYHPVQGPVKAHIQTLIERGLPAACAASIRSAEASDPALDTPPGNAAHPDDGFRPIERWADLGIKPPLAQADIRHPSSGPIDTSCRAT